MTRDEIVTALRCYAGDSCEGGAKRTARHEKRAMPILREVQTSTQRRV